MLPHSIPITECGPVCVQHLLTLIPSFKGYRISITILYRRRRGRKERVNIHTSFPFSGLFWAASKMISSGVWFWANSEIVKDRDAWHAVAHGVADQTEQQQDDLPQHPSLLQVASPLYNIIPFPWVWISYWLCLTEYSWNGEMPHSRSPSHFHTC